MSRIIGLIVLAVILSVGAANIAYSEEPAPVPTPAPAPAPEQPAPQPQAPAPDQKMNG
jgi:hypothetical protein